MGDMRGEKFTLAPLSSALPGMGGLGIEAPGITTGLRAQIACRMSGNTMQEWALDLDLDRVAILMPDLRAARERRDAGRADPPGAAEQQLRTSGSSGGRCCGSAARRDRRPQ